MLERQDYRPNDEGMNLLNWSVNDYENYWIHNLLNTAVVAAVAVKLPIDVVAKVHYMSKQYDHDPKPIYVDKKEKEFLLVSKIFCINYKY